MSIASTINFATNRDRLMSLREHFSLSFFVCAPASGSTQYPRVPLLSRHIIVAILRSLGLDTLYRVVDKNLTRDTTDQNHITSIRLVRGKAKSSGSIGPDNLHRAEVYGSASQPYRRPPLSRNRKCWSWNFHSSPLADIQQKP